MSEYFKFKNRFKESLGSLKLAKCLQLRLWDDSRYQLKQLPGIGVVTAKVLFSLTLRLVFGSKQSQEPKPAKLVHDMI